MGALLTRLAALSLALAASAAPAAAQKLLDKQFPPNHGKNDPYTRGGDPALMEAAGIASHGGFEFATTDTAGVEDQLATSEIRWLETEHFELGFALGPYKVSQKEKKAFLADLTRLAERLPDVDPKEKVLDPWLRAHLYAMRMEDQYARFLKLVRLDQAVFPDGTKPWNRQGTYRGEGPHLGQKGKYEVLILPSEAASVEFLRHFFGLSIKRTQRWNVVDRDTLTLTIHLQQGNLKDDAALHGHVAFNLMHNFLDGFEHYSYDTPIWLHEGLAHWAERRVSPDHNSFDGSEGSVPQMSKEKDWAGKTRKIVSSGDAPRMAALMRLKNYGQMSLDDHFTTWSMVDFLHSTQPEGLAALIQGLKGRTNAEGFPDGSNLPDVHRELFQEHLSMSYSAFDAAWAAWVVESYR